MPKNNVFKICMISDTHNEYDDRIYAKEALSLKAAGYEVSHICAGNEQADFYSPEGIHIIKQQQVDFSTNRYLNKLLKILFVKENLYTRIFTSAIAENADIYHIHDFKLVPLTYKIKKRTGAKIIYDVHDPFFQNIIDYNRGSFFKNRLYKIYSKKIISTEKKFLPYFDQIITTEKHLAAYYKKLVGKQAEIIYNYTTFNISEKKNEKVYDFIYCGSISVFRSLYELLEAAKILKQSTNFKFLFIGNFSGKGIKQKAEKYVKQNELEENIIFKGFVPYNEVPKYYKKSKIGLAVFQDIPTHRIIMQIKFFEYTTFGLPIIASNFGHIKNYIEKNKNGVLVTPDNPIDIAEKMLQLLKNKKIYSELSTNAIKAAPRYKWGIMEKKLLNLYKKLFVND